MLVFEILTVFTFLGFIGLGIGRTGVLVSWFYYLNAVERILCYNKVLRTVSAVLNQLGFLLVWLVLRICTVAQLLFSRNSWISFRKDGQIYVENFGSLCITIVKIIFLLIPLHRLLFTVLLFATVLFGSILCEQLLGEPIWAGYLILSVWSLLGFYYCYFGQIGIGCCTMDDLSDESTQSRGLTGSYVGGSVLSLSGSFSGLFLNVSGLAFVDMLNLWLIGINSVVGLSINAASMTVFSVTFWLGENQVLDLINEVKQQPSSHVVSVTPVVQHHDKPGKLVIQVIKKVAGNGVNHAPPILPLITTGRSAGIVVSPVLPITSGRSLGIPLLPVPSRLSNSQFPGFDQYHTHLGSIIFPESNLQRGISRPMGSPQNVLPFIPCEVRRIQSDFRLFSGFQSGANRLTEAQSADFAAYIVRNSKLLLLDLAGCKDSTKLSSGVHSVMLNQIGLNSVPGLAVKHPNPSTIIAEISHYLTLLEKTGKLAIKVAENSATQGGADVVLDKDFTLIISLKTKVTPAMSPELIVERCAGPSVKMDVNVNAVSINVITETVATQVVSHIEATPQALNLRVQQCFVINLDDPKLPQVAQEGMAKMREAYGDDGTRYLHEQRELNARLMKSHADQQCRKPAR